MVYADNQDITNKTTIKYSPTVISLEKTNTYTINISTTYKNKYTFTNATIYVCSGDYKCNISGNGCTK